MSWMQLRAADIGCVVDNTLTLQHNLPIKKYDTAEKQNAFNEALLARVRTTVPGTGYRGTDEFTVSELLSRRANTCPTGRRAGAIQAISAHLEFRL